MIKTITLISLSAFFLQFTDSYAQCIGATAPATAGSMSNDGSIGIISWNNPLNAVGSDNSRTIGSALALGQETNYLMATNFGFSLSPTTVICGITIEIERSATGVLHSVSDYSVRIIKGGVVAGSEHAQAGTWPSSDAVQTYGGSGDMWGETWTPADINAGNFGVAISADLSGISALPSARVDNMRITIHYVAPLPVSMLFFEALEQKEEVQLRWATATEINNRHFIVERSSDGMSFKEIATVEGAGNSKTKKEYLYTDKQMSGKKAYYRLKQVDFDGVFSYSDTRSIVKNTGEGLLLYPNPIVLSEPIRGNISGETSIYVTVSDITGKEIFAAKVNPDSKTGSFTVQGSEELPAGSYFVTIKGSRQMYQERFFIKQF